jgi:hypothetical protein
VSAHSPVRGFVALATAGLAVALHLWLAQSLLVPIAQGQHVEYLFLSASISALVRTLVAVWAAVFAGHWLLRRLAARLAPQPRLFSGADVQYARPLLGFAVSVVPLIALAPGTDPLINVLTYLFADLRWWWTALLLLWMAFRLNRRLPGAVDAVLGVSRWSAQTQRRAAEATLAALAIVWAVAGTPHLRFSSGTHGDEPKYVRYCEALYQGLGFEITDIQPVAALPADYTPRLWHNLRLIAEILPGELLQLARDAGTFIANPSHRFNRAYDLDVGAGFFNGKNGGLYQLHTPGLSFLMLPAYYLDRQDTTVRPDAEAHWPGSLDAVNTFFLALYAVWSVVIFRFLRHLVGSLSVAWVAAATTTLTLPLAAFPFQFYPELPGGVILFLVGGHLLFHANPSKKTVFLHGLLAGYLPWLHVRFGAMAVILLTAALLKNRDARRRLAFLVGFAIPLSAFCLYAYRLTGSVLPTAMYNAAGGESLVSLEAALWNSIGYLLDRNWGLFPHAPVYLLAVIGISLLVRRLPGPTLFGGLIFLALLVPSASVSLQMGATTPMRTILAVVPLAALPLAEVLVRFGHTRWLRVTFGTLLTVSLATALSYNLNHYKHIGWIIDSSFSGWKPNLLFPVEVVSFATLRGSNGLLLLSWIAVLLTLALLPVVIGVARMAVATTKGAAGSPQRAVLGALLLFVTAGTVVSSATGVWFHPRYRVRDGAAAMEAARFIDGIGHCAICLSSDRGQVGTGPLLDALESVSPDIVARHRFTMPTYDEWLTMPGRIRDWLTEAHGGPPPDTLVGHHLYRWRQEHVPAAEIRRRIFAEAGKPAPSQP